jgi:nicotinate-nucleotide adenylyltransferase
MPCYEHYLKQNDISPQQRYEMCVEACKDEPNIIVSRYEIELKHSGKVYDLINHIRTYDEWHNEFYYVVGLDCANHISTWYRWDDVINLIPFIVVNRIGETYIEYNRIWYNHAPHVVLQKEIVGISSSEIRRWIKEGRVNTAQIFLNERVWKYIQEKGLYK